MCSDRIKWPPALKIWYPCVFFHYRLDSGRCSPGIWFSQKFWWSNFQGLKIADDVCPLSSRLRANTLFNFIDPGMCSSAIVFIILMTSYVFLWWSIVGKNIKNRPHTFQCFKNFFQNLFGRFSWLAVLSPPPPPRNALYTNMFRRFMLFRPSFTTHRREVRKGERGGKKYDPSTPPPPHLSV
jgi:hypothetical protein